MDRSLHILTAIMAVYKTGAAYLPLDPEFPKDRLSYMLKDSKAKILIAENTTKEAVAFWEGSILEIDHLLSDSNQIKLPAPAPKYDLDRLAYIIYTSGSTGQPKGVAINHGALTNFLISMQKQPGMSKEDLLLAITTFSFDISILEICLPIVSGGTVLLASGSTAKNPESLVELMDEYKPTVMQATPSLWKGLLEYGWKGDPNLKVLCGGEALPVDLGVQLMNTAGSLWNMYGPTETTVWSLTNPIKTAEDLNSIGTSIDNTDIYVLDDELQLVPIGIEGELHIGGDGLSAGYINRPELTQKQFVTNPFKPSNLMYKTGDTVRWLENGEIKYIGRKDNQIKLNGYRIELGEIDKILNEHPSIVQALSHITNTAENSKQLVAYVVMGEQVDESALREHLFEKLPQYMIPHQFVKLDKFPLTANGKVDRKSLPLVGNTKDTSADYVPPVSTEEELLVTYFESVLGRERVGILDNFFMIGGDSIKAIQVASLMNRAGYKVTTRDMFRFPVIQNLAQIVEKSDRIAEQDAVLGPLPLTPIQQNFFTEVSVDRHHYNQSVLLHSEERLEKKAIQGIADHLMLHHDALRLTFKETDDQIIQKNQGIDLQSEVTSYDLREEENPEKVLTAYSDELQASFDLEAGPLVKFGLFHLADGDRLLIIIHHLAIDGVSWRIILEDFEILFQQHKRGEDFVLPLKTDSYMLWAQQLLEYSNDPKNLEEISYWKNLLKTNVPIIKKDFLEGANMRQHEITLDTSLSVERTSLLLSKANETYKTEINDLLLTTLSLAVNKIFKVKTLLVDLEGHGREGILNNIDVNRTVGWFTSIYPVVLDIQSQDDIGTQIKMVKERLREVPNKGIGYGILKYLTHNNKKENIAFERQPQLLFNYLGQIDEDVDQLSMSVAKESSGKDISPKGNREHEIVITNIVQDQKLRISISYGNQQYDKETINSLLQAFEKSLHYIIGHCVSEDKKDQVTPSDLGYKGLSMDQLENFFNS